MLINEQEVYSLVFWSHAVSIQAEKKKNGRQWGWSFKWTFFIENFD